MNTNLSTYCFLISLLLIAFNTPLFAKEDMPPVPSHKKEAVEALEIRIEKEKQKGQKLKTKIDKIEKDLSYLKNKLVSLASKIQDSEKEIQNIETEISDLKEEKIKIEQKLEQQYGSMGSMLLALQRIRRIPPQAMIARKTSPIDTARTALLLKDVLPTLEKQASDLQKDIDRLNTIEKTLTENKETVLSKMVTLETKQDEMNTMLSERQKLFKSASSEYKQQELSVRRISKQAKNLKDLISKLEAASEKKTVFERLKKKKTQEKKTVVVSSSGNKKAQLPVSGIIEVSYGGKDSIGASSKGLHIKSRQGALVVAPMSGIVRYAGSFKNYKNLLIIEHEDNYHSLVAGFSKIDTVVGQSVVAGEPVGILGQKNRNGNSDGSTLYYELRFKGKPINPKRKFSELQS